ncbi:archaetidylserine decarboxylase [Alkalilimnicola ehrlichii MLHE-1]|uniref:Phosphatidylserine decarboxylase proenzyme n=1 Tax=Alkalilimnicola ehrlichii (strain ATCC BAA-1101 / DSM 17681 / MLHE-1) TaxID=187272 RepID=PSD_ALKEH|nr:archaetidylserine decarboxylase [Alkalilimnicola ehrlichii]Q0AAC1.1 RecName: Full=Phosphatidylserine decarboxylase proenzyme; Contains: RecName: Full=Phosphatidylserine decarboxylase alpha chain; Contains: RecName: Full=Phosphatidylserine decarboxylase beta chain [Alkalilimnicola ehrlichii MLHE-1]ABI56216.1 phosphatidylserine decarboxylase [Alkalilimnicola ehrlichii MLHE-1]
MSVYRDESPATGLDHLKAALLYPLPHHAISRMVHWAVRVETPWFKNLLIKAFIRVFKVDMSEALEEDPTAYPTFNAFFTRALKPEARPLPDDPDAILSPADGTISQMGPIERDTIFQAKGHSFTTAELLGGDEALAEEFRDGWFATIYLSPRDYHRVHMPMTGTLRQMIHIPGRLFSVAPFTVRTVPKLFARNERVACIFDTDRGPMAVVLVGAINVGSIETVWAGEITPPAGIRAQYSNYEADNAPTIARGHEMGRFNMGSTVITLQNSRPAPGKIMSAHIKQGMTI